MKKYRLAVLVSIFAAAVLVGCGTMMALMNSSSTFQQLFEVAQIEWRRAA